MNPARFLRPSHVAIAALTIVMTISSVAYASSMLAPLPPPPTVDAEKAELGRMLFSDPRLSGDMAISCATCHDPAKHYADGLQLSRAYPGSLHFRNTRSLLNVPHVRFYFWDGRMAGNDMPSGVRNEITETHMMNMDGRIMQERLIQVPEYRERFQRAFGGEPSFGRTLKAIAEFEKTLVAPNAPLDRHLLGEPDALSAEARRGLSLFEGKAGCVGCHSGSMLTDWQPHRTGVPANPEILSEPTRHITLRSVSKFLGVPGFENLRSDPGYFAVSKREGDRGAFVTPGLREVSRTAPYMHNGMLASLADVIDFYDTGGGEGSSLPKLGLSTREKSDLVSFLEQALSGDLPRVAVSTKAPAFDVLPLGLPGGDLRDLIDETREVAEPASTAPLAALALQPPAPADNPQTPEKIELGKMLFFDGRLSGDTSSPCVVCHIPGLGWGDAAALSRGYPGTKHWRNSQTIVNSAYLAKLFWAGSSTSLEGQAPSAAKGGVAGNGEDDMMEERLRQIPVYVDRFRDVFGTAWPMMGDAWKAIAAFERTVIQTDSPFDEYMRGDAQALSESATRGLALFDGKAGCSQCHSGSLLSDERFHRLGVPDNPVFETDPLRQITHRFEQYAKGTSEAMYRKVRTDLGLYYRSKRTEHIGKFRTPPLRYTKYTAPYMHNGVFETLLEVIDFYDRGGGDVPAVSPLLRPLGLTDSEKTDLHEFLLSLSGDRLMMSAPKLPPYEVMTP